MTSSFAVDLHPVQLPLSAPHFRCLCGERQYLRKTVFDRVYIPVGADILGSMELEGSTSFRLQASDPRSKCRQLAILTAQGFGHAQTIAMEVLSMLSAARRAGSLAGDPEALEEVLRDLRLAVVHHDPEEGLRLVCGACFQISQSRNWARTAMVVREGAGPLAPGAPGEPSADAGEGPTGAT